MASNEITGDTLDEMKTRKGRYHQTRLCQEEGIPFETAFCLKKIPRQPEEYDGPQRYCGRRACKKDEYDCGEYDVGAYAGFCPPHGGDMAKVGHENKEHLESLTAAITHGAHAADEHLKMDFDEDEQALYDDIMGNWPEIYDWPEKSEDPARYRILRRVAVNEVRALREEDYLDGAEVVEVEQYGEQGVVGTKEEENPLAREYRLLMSEVTNQMRELGLTPKERQKMDTLEAQESKDDAITDIAGDALSGDEEYDPEAFDE